MKAANPILTNPSQISPIQINYTEPDILHHIHNIQAAIRIKVIKVIKERPWLVTTNIKTRSPASIKLVIKAPARKKSNTGINGKEVECHREIDPRGIANIARLHGKCNREK